MDLYVRLADSDLDALVELQHWLAYDTRLPAEARDVRPGPPTPGAQGTATDVLQLVIGNAIALAQLVLSLAQWRQSRHRPPGVLVTARRPDGVTVTIESTDPDALAEVVRKLGEP
jgi:membrane-associated two-gene conflict system component 1 (EACC1)